MKRKFRLYEDGSFTSPRSGFFSTTFGRTVLVLFIIGLSGGVFLYIMGRDLPSLSQLESYKPKLSSKVYSADLRLITEFFEEKRSFVPLEELPDPLIKALIATEDRKFYDHWGIDLRRFATVALTSMVTFERPSAISTLTQQLARQLYLTLERTITRKIKEIITAIQIERTYTKVEILEMYLNHMNFGHGSYGAQSASIKYFGKDVQELTTDECAMLVGLLKAPSHYTPFWHPNKALGRRNVVLTSMRDLNFISEDEYAGYVKKPIEVFETQNTAYGIAPYFTEYVRKNLQDQYGYDLYTDGLSIYTTIDSRAQTVAERAVQNHLPELQSKVKENLIKKDMIKGLLDSTFVENNDIEILLQDSTFVDSLVLQKVPAQAALISIDPRNGHILAMVGGRDFTKYKFNRAVQARRQPGSAFKPFVYTVAIDNGYPTTHEVLNQPVVTFMPDGSRWSPENYGHKVGGLTTFREGLRRSINLVTVRVLQNVIQKPSLVVEYAHKMGIKSPLAAVDAIALGVSDVTPLEITSAYGVFANAGVLVEPVAVLRVEDKNGNVIFEHIPRSQEVLRKQTAYIMTDMLQTVMDHGTGARGRWMYHFYRPAGGKTGTTQGYSDAWFLGFTPQIVTGVWVGLDDYTIALGAGQTGTRAALPIWAPYMKAFYDTLALPEVDFTVPDGVTRVEICLDTKKLANDVCPSARISEEVFFTNLVPKDNCDKHVGPRRTKDKRGKGKKRKRF